MAKLIRGSDWNSMDLASIGITLVLAIGIGFRVRLVDRWQAGQPNNRLNYRLYCGNCGRIY